MKLDFPCLTNTDVLAVDESNEVWNAQFLRDFEEKLYPIFKRRGIKLADAIMIWQLNQLDVRLERIDNFLNDDGLRD